MSQIFEGALRLWAPRQFLFTESELTANRVDSDTWTRFYYTRISPSLRSRGRCTVHAPTGAGKSAAMGSLLATEYSQVVYIESRLQVASTMRGFTFIHRGVQLTERTRAVYMHCCPFPAKVENKRLRGPCIASLRVG